MAVHRFLSSPYVSVERIVETLAARTAERCAGRRILVVQDTTEINFTDRDKKRRGFGPAANRTTTGFFIHPVIAVDVESEAVVGLVDAAIWTRPEARAGDQRSRPAEAKESARWLAGCRSAAETLAGAAQLTMVADRESDIYALFARRPAGLDLIVRAAQNRNLADGTKLFDALTDAPCLSTSEVRVAPRGPGDKGRTASIELRAKRVQHCPARQRPRGRLPQDHRAQPGRSPRGQRPRGKTALLWRLMTTHSVADAAQADEIVQFYRLRWRIEQTFRALKSDGLALETARSSSPSAYSTSRPWHRLPRPERASSSTPEMAAHDPPPMSSTRASRFPFRSSPAASRARPSAKRTRIPRSRSPSSPGLPPASAGGIATTSPRDQRPCDTVGRASPLPSRIHPRNPKPKSVNPVASKRGRGKIPRRRINARRRT